MKTIDPLINRFKITTTLQVNHRIIYGVLTHWGRVTHICVSKLTIIGSDNGLSPGRRQAIILTNAGIFSIGPLGTNFSEILIEIYTVLFTKMYFKMSSEKWWPSCFGLNVLTHVAYLSLSRKPEWILIFVQLWHNEEDLVFLKQILNFFAFVKWF